MTWVVPGFRNGSSLLCASPPKVALVEPKELRVINEKMYSATQPHNSYLLWCLVRKDLCVADSPYTIRPAIKDVEQ